MDNRFPTRPVPLDWIPVVDPDRSRRNARVDNLRVTEAGELRMTEDGELREIDA